MTIGTIRDAGSLAFRRPSLTRLFDCDHIGHNQYRHRRDNDDNDADFHQGKTRGATQAWSPICS